MTQRCRQTTKDERVDAFVVRWWVPYGDATAAIFCNECGETFYTHPANLELVRERGMLILCTVCLERVVEEQHGGEMRVGGRVRAGQILPAEPGAKW
jgi:ribosomal protein S27E